MIYPRLAHLFKTISHKYPNSHILYSVNRCSSNITAFQPWIDDSLDPDDPDSILGSVEEDEDQFFKSVQKDQNEYRNQFTSTASTTNPWAANSQDTDQQLDFPYGEQATKELNETLSNIYFDQEMDSKESRLNLNQLEDIDSTSSTNDNVGALLFSSITLRKFFEQVRIPKPTKSTSLNDQCNIKWSKVNRVEDFMPILNALLYHKHVDMAERVFDLAKKRDGKRLAMIMTASLPNMFIRAYLEQQDINMEKVYHWYTILEEYNIRPDIYTFAFLISHFLKCDNESSSNTKFLLEEMIRYGFTLDGLIQTGLFADTSLRLLRHIHKEWKHDDTSLDIGTISKDDSINPMNAYGAILIKKSLRAFDDASLSSNAYYLQQRLETDCHEVSKERWITSVKTMTKIHGIGRIHTIAPLLENWVQQLEKLIGKSSGDSIEEFLLGTYLASEKIARITLMNFLRVSHYSSEFNGFVFTRLCNEIGEALERELFATTVVKNPFLPKTGFTYEKIQATFQSEKLLNMSMRKIYQKLERDKEALEAGWIPKWTQESKVKIGSYLAGLVIENMRVDPTCFQYISNDSDNNEMAFIHEIIQVKSKKLGIVRMNPVIYDSIMFAPNNPFVSPMALPMVIQPKLWLTYYSGGYLNHRSICVRMKDDPLQLSHIKSSCQEGRLGSILTGLDVLGKTAWRINSRVLAVLTRAWNEELQVPEIPQLVHNPDMTFKTRQEFQSDDAYKAYCIQVKKYYNERRNAHSQRCDTFYKLEIAKRFSNWPIYFPHNVDFRGRAYPIPTHFNHIGNDMCRGLLRFDKGKPLGKDGLKWLKIHLANLYGFDKATFEEREAFTMSHLDEIMDSARDPLNSSGNEKWWMKAEDPWQCLSACIELADALNSSQPESFVSHLTIHQDGSCNGLQHYAALGKDILGAAKVNLEPSDRPQDVYSAVADCVSSFIEKDAKDGNEMAQKLLGQINRKVVKQPVMTTVYGVTLYGARRQIENRFKDVDSIPDDKLSSYSLYIAKLVFQSLGSIFDKARSIQSWLTETAYEIVSAVPVRFAIKHGYRQESRNECDEVDIDQIHDVFESKYDNMTVMAAKLKVWNPVKESKKNEDDKRDKRDEDDYFPQTLMRWTTPLGFPVTQPYRAIQATIVKTTIQRVLLHLQAEKPTPVTVSKQVAGFPPNFIHSLDASHMFMTALACYEQGLTFASVHDSYWTHAADVDILGRILREKFVELHSNPILENLRQELIQLFKDYKIPVYYPDEDDGKLKGWKNVYIPPVPQVGEFDLSKVLNSKYFFS